MLQSASGTIELAGPRGFKGSLSSKVYLQHSGQCGRAGGCNEVHGFWVSGRLCFDARIKRYAGSRRTLLPFKITDLSAQQKQGECTRANVKYAGAQHERRLCSERMWLVARCKDTLHQDAADHVGKRQSEKICSRLVAMAALTVLLYSAPADALLSTETPAVVASPLGRAQHSAQLHRHKGSAPELDKPSGEKQSEPLTSSSTNHDGLTLQQKNQTQQAASTLEESLKTCFTTIERCVEQNLSAARIAAQKGLSGLDLIGVLVGLLSGFTMGAVAVRSLQSSSGQTGGKATDSATPSPPPQDISAKDREGCNNADTANTNDTLAANNPLTSPGYSEKESTADTSSSSVGSLENEESIDSNAEDKLDDSTTFDSESKACHSYDEVTTSSLPTAHRKLLPEWKLDPGAIRIVLENRTSRPIVLFADEARPDADDSIRTAWKVFEFEGPPSPRLLELHLDKTAIGARRVEGQTLVLRSGPFAAGPKSLWVMLQPTPHHTAWMREATLDDNFFGMGSEGQITILNLRIPQWPPYDFELFVEGDLCAVYKGALKDRAYRFQTPTVFTFGVPRPGMNVKKGSAFDREVELEDTRVDLDLTVSQQGDRLCWLKLEHDAELNIRWQLEVVDIEPACS